MTYIDFKSHFFSFQEFVEFEKMNTRVLRCKQAPRVCEIEVDNEQTKVDRTQHGFFTLANTIF